MEPRSELGSTITDRERESLTAQLEAGETLLAVFAPNLDTDLQYVRGLVALTDRRLLALDPHATPPKTAEPGTNPAWQAWRLENVEQLRTSDRGGLGILELVGPAGRLAHWRFTINHDREVQQLVERLEELRRGVLAHTNGESRVRYPASRKRRSSRRGPARCWDCGGLPAGG